MIEPPESIGEAVDLLLAVLPPSALSEIARTSPAGLEDRRPFADFIRDRLKLSAKNSPLRAACETDDPDEAALTILQVLWYGLHHPEEAAEDSVPFTYHFNVNEEIAHHFDPSSLPGLGQAPEAVLLMGGIAVGKTHIRKEKYSRGYVVVDAAELFSRLSNGQFIPFPGPLEEPMNLLGGLISDRAISGRRNIVTEIIGANIEPAEQLIKALKSTGYNVSVIGVTCSVAVAEKRHASRPPNDVSAYEAEPYTIKWLLDACNKAAPVLRL